MTDAMATGLAGAVKGVVRMFLEEKHYRSLHRILSQQWANAHSLTAAVKLMEAHGVRITKEEEARLANLSEERMIDALVARMPGQSREQFEHFFLQLSLIASTTTRLRTALETGRADQIEEALDSAENVGILTYLLKMAVVQAGSEVSAKASDHNEWAAATEKKMGPLLMSQAELTQYSKALDQVKNKLGMQRSAASEKTKKVLASLAAGSTTSLLGMVMVAWDDFTKFSKRETEIGKEYEEEIRQKAKALVDYKSKQVETIRNVLMRDVEKNREELMAFIFGQFVQDWRDKKENDAIAGETEKMEAELQRVGESTANNAKKVLLRMNAASDEGLMRSCFKGLVTFHLEYQQNKEIEELTKQKEKQIAEFVKTRADGQRNVISNLINTTATGMVMLCLREWRKETEGEIESQKMQEQLDEKMSKLGMFADKNKGAAMKAASRLALLMENGVLIVSITAWKKWARMERTRRYASDKNKKKREQLLGVKDLFKGFAKDLEGGLKEGTPRVEPPPRND